MEERLNKIQKKIDLYLIIKVLSLYVIALFCFSGGILRDALETKVFGNLIMICIGIVCVIKIVYLMTRVICNIIIFYLGDYITPIVLTGAIYFYYSLNKFILLPKLLREKINITFPYLRLLSVVSYAIINIVFQLYSEVSLYSNLFISFMAMIITIEVLKLVIIKEVNKNLEENFSYVSKIFRKYASMRNNKLSEMIFYETNFHLRMEYCVLNYGNIIALDDLAILDTSELITLMLRMNIHKDFIKHVEKYIENSGGE